MLSLYIMPVEREIYLGDEAIIYKSIHEKITRSLIQYKDVVLPVW